VRQTTNPQGPGSSDSISAAAAVRSTGGSLPKPAAVLLGQAAPAAWLTATVGSVAEQLALDEALLEAAHAGHVRRPVVRTWMAAEPTVVVGSSSRIDEEVDRAACVGAGIPILRRPSGGLTVVLGPGCVMWSVVAPLAAAAPAIDRIHSAILDPLVAALVTAGRPVVRRGSSDLAFGTADGERKGRFRATHCGCDGAACSTTAPSSMPSISNSWPACCGIHPGSLLTEPAETTQLSSPTSVSVGQPSTERYGRRSPWPTIRLSGRRSGWRNSLATATPAGIGRSGWPDASPDPDSSLFSPVCLSVGRWRLDRPCGPRRVGGLGSPRRRYELESGPDQL